MTAIRSLIMKPATLSILTGIMIGTSYIPFPPWAIFFCFVPLWLAWLENPTYKKVFLTGWIAQFILTLIGFNWVAHTVHEFGHLPWAVAVIVLMLFCAFANLYLPVAGVLWLWFSKTFKLSRLGSLWAIPLFVAALERVMPTIFDWHFGYTWLWSRLPGLQLADLVGFIGLSSIGIFANVFLLYAWDTRRFAWALATPAIFIALNVAGYVHGPGKGLTDKTLRVLLVQANIGNQEKLASEQGNNYRNNVIAQFTDETTKGLATEGAADFAIWPETAFPDLIQDPHLSFGYANRLKLFIQQSKTGLITGGYSHDLKGKLTNSFFVMNSDGEWLSPPYHKTMLLAFGEYFPGGEIFPQLYNLIPEVGNLGRGPGPTVMHLPNGLDIGPQICYEGLFDWFARSLANQGAQMVVNITNDSWYGTWEEPFQHGYMTLAKAVEIRRPVIRSTNTGISAVALANGDILNLSPLHQTWFHLYEVPYASAPGKTFFMGFGYWLVPLLMLFGLLAILIKGRKT